MQQQTETDKNKPDKNSFEEAFQRLEKILEQMNEEELSLDSSLKLFEEADSLIGICNKKLKTAEQKIEMLLKNRQNELSLDENSAPLKEEFEIEDKNLFNTRFSED